MFQINQNKNGIAPDIYLSNLTDTSTRRNVYTGFEVGTNARLPRRTLMFAGWTIERTIDVACNSTRQPEHVPLLRSVRQRRCLGEPAVSIPYLHEFKLNAQRAAVVRLRGQRVAAELRRARSRRRPAA